MSPKNIKKPQRLFLLQRAQPRAPIYNRVPSKSVQKRKQDRTMLPRGVHPAWGLGLPFTASEECLRRWQRSILVTQPTHPDLFAEDRRMTHCTVCLQRFSCPLPSRHETWPELDVLCFPCFVFKCPTCDNPWLEFDQPPRGFRDWVASRDSTCMVLRLSNGTPKLLE